MKLVDTDEGRRALLLAHVLEHGEVGKTAVQRLISRSALEGVAQTYLGFDADDLDAMLALLEKAGVLVRVEGYRLERSALGGGLEMSP